MDSPPSRNYTCSDYRDEMRLLGLKLRLGQKDLPEDERRRIADEIERLERAMEMG